MNTDVLKLSLISNKKNLEDNGKKLYYFLLAIMSFGRMFMIFVLFIICVLCFDTLAEENYVRSWYFILSFLGLLTIVIILFKKEQVILNRVNNYYPQKKDIVGDLFFQKEAIIVNHNEPLFIKDFKQLTLFHNPFYLLNRQLDIVGWTQLELIDKNNQKIVLKTVLLKNEEVLSLKEILKEWHQLTVVKEFTLLNKEPLFLLDKVFNDYLKLSLFSNKKELISYQHSEIEKEEIIGNLILTEESINCKESNGNEQTILISQIKNLTISSNYFLRIHGDNRNSGCFQLLITLDNDLTVMTQSVLRSKSDFEHMQQIVKTWYLLNVPIFEKNGRILLQDWKYEELQILKQELGLKSK